jgi:hypothetical protein
MKFISTHLVSTVKSSYKVILESGIMSLVGVLYFCFSYVMSDRLDVAKILIVHVILTGP